MTPEINGTYGISCAKPWTWFLLREESDVQHMRSQDVVKPVIASRTLRTMRYFIADEKLNLASLLAKLANAYCMSRR